MKYTEILKAETFMKQQTKKIIKWILIIAVILVAGYFYAFVRRTGYTVAEGVEYSYVEWDLETMVVFCLGALYLVGLSKILTWMFRK